MLTQLAVDPLRQHKGEPEMHAPGPNDPPFRKQYLKTYPSVPVLSIAGKHPGFNLWVGDIPRPVDTDEIGTWCQKDWELLECIVKPSTGGSDMQFAAFTFHSKEGCTRAMEALAGWMFNGNRYMKPRYICYTEQR